jgi:hypothetical protein
MSYSWKCDACHSAFEVDGSILDDAVDDLLDSSSFKDKVEGFVSDFQLTGENADVYGGSASVIMPARAKLEYMVCENQQCQQSQIEVKTKIKVMVRVTLDFTNRAERTALG